MRALCTRVQAVSGYYCSFQRDIKTYYFGKYMSLARLLHMTHLPYLPLHLTLC
jgi:hypothetical protein